MSLVSGIGVDCFLYNLLIGFRVFMKLQLQELANANASVSLLQRNIKKHRT